MPDLVILPFCPATLPVLFAMTPEIRVLPVPPKVRVLNPVVKSVYTLPVNDSVPPPVMLLVTVALPPRPEAVPLKVRLSLPETVVVLAFNQRGLATVRAEPLACRADPLRFTNVVALKPVPVETPKALSEAMTTVPPASSFQAKLALLLSVLFKVLAPERTSVPTPVLVMGALPAMTALMVAVLPVPRALTVMVPSPVRVLAAFPLLLRIQLPAVAVLLSPKTRLLMVRALSKLTVRSAVILLVKFAAALSAMMLFNQFVLRLQMPLASTFHVPAAACADCVASIAAIAEARAKGMREL